MRALVTGAAGHIGTWVARTLRDAGWEVVGLDQKPCEPGIESVRVDVCDANRVARAAQGVDAIFHLAMQHAQHLKGEAAEAALRDVAIGGLESVVEAARLNDARLVVTSTAGAVGEVRDPRRPPNEEIWNPNPVTPYTKSKIAAERRLWEFEGVDAIAVLPGMTVGPDDPHGGHSNARILQMMRRARLPVAFEGGLNVADVRDIARGHLLAFEKGESGQRYLLGGTNLTFKELWTEIRKVRGLGKARFTVPRGPLVAGVGLYERAARLARQRPFVTREQVAQRIGSYAYVDDSRARRDLGYASRPLDETLRDLARWAA